ncbi:MAG: TonB-dependent receptor [bacterium]
MKYICKLGAILLTLMISVHHIAAERSPLRSPLIPAGTSIISREEIIQSNANDLGELLEHYSFMSIGRIGDLGSLSTVSMRGSTAEQVLILIDGRQANDTSFGTALSSQILLNHVERIEIIRGGTSILYGARAIGGIINVITRTPVSEIPITDVQITYGGNQKKLYHYGFGKKIRSFEIYASGDKQASDGFRDNGGLRLDHAFSHIGYDFKRFGKITLKGDLYRGTSGIPGPNTTPVDQWNDDLERKAATLHDTWWSDNRYGLAAYDLSISEQLNLHASMYGNINEKQFEFEDSALNEFHENKTIGGEARIDLPLYITVGGDCRQDALFSRDITTGEGIAHKKFINRAIYINQQFTCGSLTIAPGLRFDNHSDYDDQTNPYAEIAYQSNDTYSFSAHAARSNRFPVFNEVLNNVNINPEIGTSYDFGIQKTMHNSGRQITLFKTNTKDIITWEQDIVSRLFKPVNLPGTTISEGVEIESWRNISADLSHTISYTYNSVKNTKTGKTPAYKPAHKVNYTVRLCNAKGSAVRIEVHGIGRQYTSQNMTSSIPGYGLVDMRLSQKIYTCELSLGIGNILNKRYLTRASYPLGGRTYYAAVSISLLD